MGSKRLIVVAVCLAAVLAPLAPAGTKKLPIPNVAVTNSSKYRLFAERLPASEMTVQAIERLTFGPRPNDVDAVNRMGLAKWLDLELHPEKASENPALISALEPYESLRMNAHDIFLRYPPPQLIAAIARGRQPMPADPELREVVEQLVGRYLRKQQGNEAAAAAPDDADLEPKVPLTAILPSWQIDLLAHGDADSKSRVLASIPESRAMEFAYALKPVQRRQLLALSPAPLERKMLLSLAPPQVVLFDLTSAKIMRAVYSEHQLEEEMVDFWFNHFNVFFDKGADRYLVTAYERDAIRRHVFGKFYDLLLATAESPAMLFYLDNAESVSPSLNQQPFADRAGANRPKRGLNENYGRELMELHTLGVNGGYTQKDVIEVARCFTGWTISPPRKGSVFEFNEKVHDEGQKVVLGHLIRAGGGMEDGLEVLKILARSPKTARHISLELAERFVADDPPPSLVNRMAATYMRTDGDIREVIRTMILSPEFFSEGAYHAKVKTPFEMIVSAVRATDAEVESPFALNQQITQLGEPLYRKIEPTGYSSANAEWVSSAALLSRMNFALALANGRVPGVRVDPSQWNQIAASDPMEVARIILADDPAPATAKGIQEALTSETVRQQLAESARLKAPTTPGLVVGLVIGSPEFQRR
ncbi:MAG: DUF1800 domain-containing protein [Bryobacteraceae bacterium]